MPVKTTFINTFYRLQSHIQLLTTIMRINSLELAGIIASAAVLAFEAISMIAGLVTGTNWVLMLVAIGTPIIVIVVPLMREIIEMLRNRRIYVVQKPQRYHDDVLSQIKLSEQDLASGYRIKTFAEGERAERYVESDRINRLLALGTIEKDAGYAIPIEHRRGKQELADELRPMAASIMMPAFKTSRHKRLFNGRLLRMCDDLIEEGGRILPVTVQETRYFDTLCTNEMTFGIVQKTDSLHDRFLGETLIIDEQSTLLPYNTSRCSNYMGSSTLSITADNYIMLNQQGLGNRVNEGRIAPPGSGSVDYRDLTRIEKAKGAMTLQQVVIDAAERELREECGLAGSVEMESHVIGYAKLLERGGKPDFFCITRVAARREELDAYWRQRDSEIALSKKPFYSHIDEGMSLSSSFVAAVEAMKKSEAGDSEKPQAVETSIQVHILLKAVAAFESTEAGRETITRWLGTNPS